MSPPAGQLKVFTTSAGRMAKAGHDLELEVVRWRLRLFVVDGALREVNLTADPRSLRVLSGKGGRRSLGDEDKADIQQKVHEEVLAGRRIEFQSSDVQTDGDDIRVHGELELGDQKRPLTFAARMVSDDRIHSRAVVRQTDFGIKPYSAMFGALKVGDEVRVELETNVPA